MAAENDSELEAEFIASWNWMEHFYEGFIELPRWQYVMTVLGLIKELRQRGYDRQFRAGQSLATFILSRSRKHELRGDQTRLYINMNSGGGMRLTYREPQDVDIEFEAEKVEVTPEVEEFLQRLLSHPID